MEAEKVMLDKRQALEERKFRLSQEEVRLNLEAEMVKSAAKGQALAAIGDSIFSTTSASLQIGV